MVASGLRISWAILADNCPSDASFSCCARLNSWRKSSIKIMAYCCLNWAIRSRRSLKLWLLGSMPTAKGVLAVAAPSRTIKVSSGSSMMGASLAANRGEMSSKLKLSRALGRCSCSSAVSLAIKISKSWDNTTTPWSMICTILLLMAFSALTSLTWRSESSSICLSRLDNV